MSNPAIDDWLQTQQGRYVMDWEMERIDTLVVDLFGYNALQLGLPELDLLAHNRIPLRQVAGETGKVDVVCALRELPFAANSIDLVVLPHVLEFHDNPHQILREVERILIPDGQLVVTGFNPLSLWGLRRRLPVQRQLHLGASPQGLAATTQLRGRSRQLWLLRSSLPRNPLAQAFPFHGGGWRSLVEFRRRRLYAARRQARARHAPHSAALGAEQCPTQGTYTHCTKRNSRPWLKNR